MILKFLNLFFLIAVIIFSKLTYADIGDTYNCNMHRHVQIDAMDNHKVYVQRNENFSFKYEENKIIFKNDFLISGGFEMYKILNGGKHYFYAVDSQHPTMFVNFSEPDLKLTYVSSVGSYLILASCYK